jgi:hypothetical protein
MERKDDEVFGAAIGAISERAAQTCPTCGRGAADSAAPTLDDLEALINIRDGFNKHRKDFSPLVEDHFRRFDRTISYLHRMIAGSKG